MFNTDTDMGIIYLDTYTTSHGLNKKGVYISFSCEPITFTKKCSYDPYGLYQSNIPTELIEDREYIIRTHYRIWWDQDAHDMGKPFIDRIKLNMTLLDPKVMVYQTLYEELKRIYSSYCDVWEESRC